MFTIINRTTISVRSANETDSGFKILQVNFLVPSVKDEYMYQPGGYINRLLGSDHKGGLSDYLQKLGVAESVSAGFRCSK